MLFAENQTIKELIVQELSYSPSLTLQELTEKISPKLKQKITLQGWYKALKILIAQGIIIKEKKKYILNTSWVVDVLQWSHRLKNVYIEKENEPVIALPKKEREKVTFKFPDLLTMNGFWAHLLVYIGSQNPKDPIIYAYNPHFWFYLAQSAVEKQYNRGLESFGIKTLIIIGSNSFLDKWNAQFFEKTSIEYYFSKKPFYPDQTKYINYFGDYLIEVKVKKEMAKKIDHLFKNTISLSDISQLELMGLFQEKSLCTITVSKDGKKGGVFKRKIKRYF